MLRKPGTISIIKVHIFSLIIQVSPQYNLSIHQLASAVARRHSSYSSLINSSNIDDFPRQAFNLNKYRTSSNIHTTPSFGNTRTLSSLANIAANMTTAFDYPQTEREPTEETLFGVRVPDPYRYLEDPDSERAVSFVEKQNAVTQLYLNKCPHRDSIRNILKKYQDYNKMGSPFKRGDKYYFYMNTGLQPQYVIYQVDSCQGNFVDDSRVFIDPTTFSEDGTVSISSPIQFSHDFKYVAYCLSYSGSDWVEIRIKDVATGKDLPDILKRAKFTSIAWTGDNLGFFYAKYPENKTADTTGEAKGSNPEQNKFHSVYYHRLNTPQTDDALMLAFPDNPHMKIGFEITDDAKYLNVYPRDGCQDNEWYYCDLTNQLNTFNDSQKSNGEQQLKLSPIYDKMEAEFSYIANNGKTFYSLTNLDAKNYRIVKIDLDKPSKENWVDIVSSHEKDVITGAEMYTVDGKDLLLVSKLRNVVEYLELVDIDGKIVRTFDLPVGTISKHYGLRNDNEVFFQVTSFLTPGQIYRYDLNKMNENPIIIRQNRPKDFNPDDYTIEQVFYKSLDGTEIPMFIVHGKTLKMDGSNPCILYGYGGFNIAISPSFNINRVAWYKNFKGILAVANIRGGGEFGQDWHDSGRLLKKQNVFDDFIAAAQFLIDNKYTKRERIAIEGGSNGGLLVSAVSNQRPDLIGASICHVGVLDMIRYSSFTIGSAWISDYGDPNEKENFENLIKYSPYHNIPAATEKYPATLLLTADHDDRVVPAHSFKFIAQLQHTLGAKLNETPLLIRVETKAGHGSGKSVSKVIDEYTDVYSFLYNVLHLDEHFTNN